MARTKHKHKYWVQFIEYCVSGGAYFWSGYLFFFLADQGLHWSLWWAKLGANMVGWTVNFTLQRFWVFGNSSLRGHATQVTGRYAFITLVDFVMDYFIVAGLKGIGVSPYIGQFASAGFFTPWNYLWYRFWVFPEKLKKKKLAHHGPFRLIAHRSHGHSAYRRLDHGR